MYGRSRHAQELLSGAEWIDKIIFYDLDDVKTFRQRRALGARLRARRFDAWFYMGLDRNSFTRSLRDMILVRLAGARWACGWRLEHIGFAAKAEAEVMVFPNEVTRLMDGLRRSGLECDAPRFPLPIDTSHDRSVHEILLGFGVDEGPLVAVAPGARRSCNLWPAKRFATVIAGLIADGAKIVLLGGPDDTACDQLASRLRSRVANLAGKLSLLESCALLRKCDLMICVDSAPQHLAAAVGTPCVALFSQRNQRSRWYPYGDNHIVLEGSVECHTCLLDACPYDNRCLKQISVGDVLDAARRKLRLCARPEVAQPSGRVTNVGVEAS